MVLILVNNLGLGVLENMRRTALFIVSHD